VERRKASVEFTIKRDVFLGGIQKTLGIVEKKTTMPILNNVLIRTQQNRIQIVASDREMGLVAEYEAEIIRDGDITLSARKLHEMVRETQGERIHVEKNERNQVTVSCNKAVFRISGLPADEYPAVVDNESLPVFYKINGAMLKEMIRKTAFAMSTDEMRKNLNGVLLETEKIGETVVIRMVATDGHRLALANLDPREADFLVLERGVIIPRKGLGEIRRLVEDEQGDLFFGVRQGICVVKTDHVLLKVSLIDGDYPEYRRVIPVERGILINVNKNDFLHALRRMSVISSERYNGVIVTVSDNRLVFNSTNPDVGEANDEMEVSYQGEERSVGYNVSYLTDAVEVIDEDRVEFEIGAGMKPGVIRALGNDKYFCIVMPLKL
jgi:DNA polymerase III subunit beta